VRVVLDNEDFDFHAARHIMKQHKEL
jgi:hypothetical protein